MFSVDFDSTVTLTYHHILFVLNVLEAHALNFTGLILIGVIENFHDEHRFQGWIVHRLINGCYTIGLVIQIFILTEGNCSLWTFTQDFQDFDLLAGFRLLLLALARQYLFDFLVGNFRACLAFTVHLLVVNGAFSTKEVLWAYRTCLNIVGIPLLDYLILKFDWLDTHWCGAALWWAVQVASDGFTYFHQL